MDELRLRALEMALESLRAGSAETIGHVAGPEEILSVASRFAAFLVEK